MCAKAGLRILVAVSLIFLATIARGQSTPLAWKVGPLPAGATGLIALRDSKQVVVSQVSASRVGTAQRVKTDMEKQTGIAVDFYLQSGQEPNAFSTYLNGTPVVGINLGMLDMLGEDSDAYAAVIGHEFAHLKLGHREARQQREGIRQGISSILGFVLGRAGIPVAGTLSDIATNAVSRTFSRDEERDSDALGLQYAAQAGYDPSGAIRIWEKMASRGGGTIPFLATHPSSEERVANMRKLAVSVAASKPRNDSSQTGNQGTASICPNPYLSCSSNSVNSQPIASPSPAAPRSVYCPNPFLSCDKDAVETSAQPGNTPESPTPSRSLICPNPYLACNPNESEGSTQPKVGVAM
jgi:Zn-dependent protease with chaperone function